MLGFVVGRQARSCRTHPHPASLPRSRRGRASRGPLPPPPPLPPRSFSVSAEAAILLLPRAGVGGPSPLQVRPPAGPPPHGLRPLRTVSPRPPLSTPAVRSGCHFRRGAASGGGGGRPGLSVTGGAAGGRHLREGPQHHRPLWRSRARALAAQVQTQEGRTLLVPSLIIHNNSVRRFEQQICCHLFCSSQTEVSTRPPSSWGRTRLQRSSLCNRSACLQVSLNFETVTYPYNLFTLPDD